MISLNQQPAEKPARRSDGQLDVINIFITIQGEGPFVGQPSVFVRLAGCSLACFSCDTQYTDGRHLLHPVEILKQVQDKRKSGLVVLTGGEPLRQDVGPFISLLFKNGYRVQIETNGIHHPPFYHGGLCTIVCSPKTPKLNPDLEQVVSAYKYVVEASYVSPDDGLPTRVLGENVVVARPRPGFDRNQVYVQPCDEQDVTKNLANTNAAVYSCLQFGWRFGLQVHKFVGLD